MLGPVFKMIETHSMLGISAGYLREKGFARATCQIHVALGS